MTSCSQHKSPKEDVVQSSIPSLYITADSVEVRDVLYEIPRKKIAATATFIDSDGDTLYHDNLKYIKSRGNSTFTCQNKKPFAIKLVHSCKFPRLTKAKKFILLANAYDESHIRTAIGFDLAKSIGLLAPNYLFVSLYINDEYKGLYQMTNKIDVDKHFVHIHNLERENKLCNEQEPDLYKWFCFGKPGEPNHIQGRLIPNSPREITGGYLLNYSQWIEILSRKESAFTTQTGDVFFVESPEHASESELCYIRDFCSVMQQAIQDTTNNDYSLFLDIESFARAYLLQEIMVNVDAGIASCHMYKDVDGKMIAGPIWDLDRTLNDTNWVGRWMSPNAVWAAAPWGRLQTEDMQVRQTSQGIFYNLYQRRDFREYVQQLYQNEISEKCHHYLDSGRIEDLINELHAEIERDSHCTQNRQSSSFLEAVNRPVLFLKERISFLDWYYSTPSDSMICLTYTPKKSEGPHDKQLKFYYPKGEPIVLPKRIKNQHQPMFSDFWIFDEEYNHTPYFGWRIAGTDSILTDGMCLYADKDIEIGAIPPSWDEVQKRRIKKKLHKILW